MDQSSTVLQKGELTALTLLTHALKPQEYIDYIIQGQVEVPLFNPLNLIRSFWLLHRSNKRLVILVAPLLLMVRLAFICLPYRWFRRFFIDIAQTWKGRSIGSDLEAWRILRLVEAVSHRLPLTSHCLTKAVVAKWLLHRVGYTVNLKIGISLAEKSKVAGHAWLESDGRVVLGYMKDLDSYKVFPEIILKSS